MPYQSSIITQLRHDATFAWFLRDGAEYNPNYRKKQLDGLDDRLNGYLRCLVLTETQGEPMLSRIPLHDWGAVYTVAYISIITDNESTFHNAVDAVAKEEQSRELSHALRNFSFETVTPFINHIAHHTNPWVQVAVIRAVGHHFDEINPDWLLPHL
ncbi:MAG: hypothetical protein KZQ86_00650, partial [Candidatus Thiodiazotropha sp. (ex Lucinoma kastoroae)]|nr:hypothetical protein [Candidatus Thiodiazotropha sp. (ex Lucinoma kastoroae)]